MNLRVSRDDFASIVENFLDPYKSALFGLLFPYIAPLLIETAFIVPFTWKLGSLVFGGLVPFPFQVAEILAELSVFLFMKKETMLAWQLR